MTPSRILIIGHDDNVGKFNALILDQAGYLAQYIQTLTQGQAIFEAETPDLLIMHHDSATVSFYHSIRSNPLMATFPIIIVRCERRASRELYTTVADSALIIFPIIYTPEELTEAVARLLSAVREQ